MGIKFELESDLEELLFDSMKDGWCIATQREVLRCFRQFDLCGYGIADLVTISANETSKDHFTPQIDVYELKNGPINTDAVGQIARYLRGFERAVAGNHLPKIKICGHVIGNSIDLNGDVVFLLDCLPTITPWVFSLDPHEGIQFSKSSGWFKENEDFEKLKITKKDIDHVVNGMKAAFDDARTGISVVK